MFKLFLRYCYDPDDQKVDLFSHTYVPRPNDFSDISEYFVRKVGGVYHIAMLQRAQRFEGYPLRYLESPI